VSRDKDGKPLTVRYEQVNAMLLNEFLKEHKKVETQEATIGATKIQSCKAGNDDRRAQERNRDSDSAAQRGGGANSKGERSH